MIREALFVVESKGGIVDIKYIKKLFNSSGVVSTLKTIVKHKDMKDLVKHYETAEKSIVYFFPGSMALKLGGSKMRTKDYKGGAKASFSGGSLVKFLEQKAMNLIIDFNPKKSISNQNKMIFLGLYALVVDNRVEAVEDKTERVETAEVLSTKGKMKGLKLNKNGMINLKIGKTIYEVIDFVQVSGRPKADMTFVNKDGRPIVFVSHKGGKRPGDFQQYGGAQDIDMDNKTGEIGLSSESKEDVANFLRDVEQAATSLGAQRVDGKVDFNSLPKGSNFAKAVSSKEIFGLVMFGKDFDTNRFGLNNCHILLDGNIEFDEVKDGVYEPTASYHTFVNPQEKGGDKFPTKESDVYFPHFIITKSSSQGLNQGGLLNARFGIWPNNKVAKSYSKKLENILGGIGRF